jgi:glycosyltransferase involved in cell wall biosynthesis
MRILYFGEYSGLHTLLARGMKELGHTVTTVGNGNMFHDFPRDIDIQRGNGRLSGVKHYLRLSSLLPKFRNYDIVQLINPECFGLKAEREYTFYRFLRRHNRRIITGAFGCDWYWVDDGLNHKTFRYGDFYIGDKMRTDAAAQEFMDDYYDTPKGEYTRYVMEDADWIPTCVYEYQACYSRYFPDKTQFIPLPIETNHDTPVHEFDGRRVRFFIGIDKKRSQYKGTDIMLSALEEVVTRNADLCEMVKVESLPYAEYEKSMNSCDVMLDQLYSYTPSMNSLLAMSKGIVVVGGGEPESYELLQEDKLRPIINVVPTRESVIQQLEWIIRHPDLLNQLKADSITYVKKHHDYRKVAQAYEAMYERVLKG